MELIALLSNSDDITIPNVKGALNKYTVYPLKTLEELEELYSNIPLSLFLIDTSSHRLSSLVEFLNRIDDSKVVLISPEQYDRYHMENLPQSVFDCIVTGSIRTDLPKVVEKALERQRFKNEIRLMRQSRAGAEQANHPIYGRPEKEGFQVRPEPVSGGRFIQEKVIVNFAKMMSVSFDMSKLLDHFIDSVMEISRVSKMSVMLRDKEAFRVKTHYGLDPYIADNLKLRSDSALVGWHRKYGRIVHKPVDFMEADSISIKNEMEALQCSISFPMIYKGKLIGIFNIDNKITSEPFYREELEIIYVLCNYLAAAVKDIDLYHKMWYQKEFTKNILSSMTSGMIAVDRNEKITIFNQQASETLGLESSKMVGSDLRVLPSPLGDILFETMTSGKLYIRHEVQIGPDRLPLGINSYRLLDELETPVGAGIIFSDLSDSKKLEEQRRRSEKLEAVNDLMAKIAHEVRNPLTSIQTYIQLLNEKNTDEELGKFYTSTVSDSIKRLDGLIDKLVTFSSKQDYNFQKTDINDFLVQVSTYASRKMPRTHQFTRKLSDKVFYINADMKQLVKSVYYILLCIIDRTPEGTSIEMRTNFVVRNMTFVEILISYSGEENIGVGENNLLKPLLEIDHLGTELNLPISRKIIEGHKGSLELSSRAENNFFSIKLPVYQHSSSNVSAGGGH